jgi:outer membrane lipoprotein-sorting protein
MPTRSNKLLVALFCAFGFCPYGARAQSLSAADILQKVAERYRQVSTYSVVAEKAVDLNTDATGEIHNPYKALPPNTVVAGSNQSEYIQVTLLASSSSKAKLQLKDGRKEIVVTSDGKRVSTLVPSRHEYTEAPAESMSIQMLPDIFQIGGHDLSGVDLLKKYEALVTIRFQNFPEARWAKLEKSKTLKVGKVKRKCYVLTIQVPGGVERQRLWVDKKEFTVWKSVDTTHDPEDFWGDILHTTVTVTMKQMIQNPSLDESNFAFTPPDQAKRIDALKLSGNNPF